MSRRLMTRRGCSDTWRRKPRAGHRTGHTKLARNAATFALLARLGVGPVQMMFNAGLAATWLAAAYRVWSAHRWSLAVVARWQL